MPAAVMGDMCTCVGPPDSIVLGSSGVLIGGKPAARMGDQCAHGGAIVVGCPTVLIGETSSGSAGGVAAVAALKIAMPDLPKPLKMQVVQMDSLKNAAKHGTPLVHDCINCSVCKSNA
jgi:hypothetical protein